MLKMFWKAKRKNLLWILGGAGVLLAIRLLAPEDSLRPKYRYQIEFFLLFILPGGIFWEWVQSKSDLRRRAENNNSEDKHFDA